MIHTGTTTISLMIRRLKVATSGLVSSLKKEKTMLKLHDVVRYSCEFCHRERERES